MGGAGFFLSSCSWCREMTVHCSLSSWTVDGDLFMQAVSFLFLFLGGGGEGSGRGGRVVNAKSSQVLDVFPKEFPIAPHFYPICFGKCCPPFTCVGGSKGRNSILQNRTLYFLHRFFFKNFKERWANQIGSLQKEN
jgi:hypothetical protein